MLTYTSTELRALASVNLTPPRAVRKTLFTFGLWLPARQRRRRPGSSPRRLAAPHPSTVHNACDSGGRSADPSSMTIGWLNACSVRNKADVISDTITDRSLDVLALQETWHTASDDTCLRLITPTDYAVVDTARTTGPGGGVAIVFRKNMKCSRVSMPECRTFESICVRLTAATGPIIIMNVYRPGSEKRPSTLFYDELSSVLEALVLYACPVVIGGDFNIHVQDRDDPDARRLADLLASFDLVQHVRGPTHRCGNTLDLIITPATCQLDDVTVDPAGMLSDHSLVIGRLPVAVEPALIFEQQVRAWRRVDRAKLGRALEESELCQPVSSDADVDRLFDTYDAVLRDIADRMAPLHTIRRRRGRLAPWFDAECHSERRECRRLERRYSRTCTAEDRRLWVNATRSRHQTYRNKEQYWLARLTRCGRSSS